MDVFCTKCGTQLVDGICPNCSGKQYAPQSQQSVSAERQDKNFKDVFINPKEKFVCSLGNDYIQNFFAGGLLNRGYAIVSDKRFYFKGKGYEINGNKINVKKTESTVDLRDITGTEVRTFSNIALLIWGVFIFFAPILLSAVFPTFSVSLDSASGWIFLAVYVGVLTILFIGYGASRKTVLTIMFGGGGISVPLKWYSSRESEDFQRMLRLTKDNVIRTAENATAEAIRELAENIGTQTVNS